MEKWEEIINLLSLISNREKKILNLQRYMRILDGLFLARIDLCIVSVLVKKYG